LLPQPIRPCNRIEAIASRSAFERLFRREVSGRRRNTAAGTPSSVPGRTELVDTAPAATSSVLNVMIEVPAPPAVNAKAEGLIKMVPYAGGTPCVRVSGPANSPTLATLIVEVPKLADATVIVFGAKPMVKVLARIVSENGGEAEPLKRVLAAYEAVNECTPRPRDVVVKFAVPEPFNSAEPISAVPSRKFTVPDGTGGEFTVPAAVTVALRLMLFPA